MLNRQPFIEDPAGSMQAVRSPRSPRSVARAYEDRVPINKNTNWLNSRGSWTFYLGLIFVSWLLLVNFMDPGMAWTYVHLGHGVLTYLLLHHFKGSPIQSDQGKYDSQTFWEQMDDGVQFTSNRKFFTAVPVALFLLASHTTDYRRQPMGLNLAVVVLLLLAKLPAFHRVRIFGINKY